jgi:hypothetical protein
VVPRSPLLRRPAGTAGNISPLPQVAPPQIVFKSKKTPLPHKRHKLVRSRRRRDSSDEGGGKRQVQSCCGNEACPARGQIIKKLKRTVAIEISFSDKNGFPS